MSKGISLHIGLNHVNPDAYNGWDGALSGCINDANSMEYIATSQGFQTNKLIDSQATSSQVVSKICQISQQLQNGDIFLLTYSGHGGQLPDETGLEDDKLDETWVLWDRELLDNELYCLWNRFASGVRIFVTSDSCHSGTVVKLLFREQMRKREKVIDIQALKRASEEQVTRNRQLFSSNLKTMIRSSGEPRPKFIPIDVSLRSYQNKREDYKYYNSIAGTKSQNNIEAQLLFISGCQDNQFSYDGDDNGLFTGNLLRVWDNGGFSGTHQNFFQGISALMPDYQTPNFMSLGMPINGYIEQKPFTVQLGSTTGGTGTGTSTTTEPQRPSITAASSWGRNNQAPVFQINKGGNPYYYVEVASDYDLLNSTQHGNERNDQNFYATWADSEVSPRLTSASFQLPETAWENLKNNNRLYFKVGTTSSSDPYTWDNHMVSHYEDEVANAPSMEIVASQVGTPSTQPGGAKISASVGRGGINKSEDVLCIQKLLNQVPENEGGPSESLVEDGLIGKKTIRAIEDYQEAIGINPPDGLISPTGPTFASLSAGKSSISIPPKEKSKVANNYLV